MPIKSIAQPFYKIPNGPKIDKNMRNPTPPNLKSWICPCILPTQSKLFQKQFKVHQSCL